MAELTACQGDEDFQASDFPSSVPTVISFNAFPWHGETTNYFKLKKKLIIRAIFQNQSLKKHR